MNRTDDIIKPIQIIGTQRSGSNLLRLILNQSSKVSARHPPHILKVFFPILNKYGDLNQEQNFAKLVNDVCRLIEVNPVKWNLELDRTKVQEACKQPTLIEIFKVVYQMMAQNDSSEYWCCKSMTNVNFYEAIEQNGMKPFYIHLIRDGRDVASSFKKTLVGEKHVYHLANIWKKNYLKAKEAFTSIDNERCLTVKYEVLISNPMKVIQDINDFLGLDLDESALNYFDSKESKNTAAAGFMWSNLTVPIMANNTKKFLKELTKDEIEIFERVAGDILEAEGYELCTKSTKNGFSLNEIQGFDTLNKELKKEAFNSNHLKTDIECRIKRKALLSELKS